LLASRPREHHYRRDGLPPFGVGTPITQLVTAGDFRGHPRSRPRNFSPPRNFTCLQRPVERYPASSSTDVACMEPAIDDAAWVASLLFGGIPYHARAADQIRLQAPASRRSPWRSRIAISASSIWLARPHPWNTIQLRHAARPNIRLRQRCNAVYRTCLLSMKSDRRLAGAGC